MTVPALTLRQVTAEHVVPVHALIEKCFRGPDADKGWCSEAGYFTSPRITPEGMLEKFNNPNTTMLAGYDPAGALIVCCELLKKENGSCYFGLFAVDPARQGGGIGSYILREAESHARTELGCSKMEMQVIESRDTLLAYYIRRGYVMTKERRPFPYHLFDKGTVLQDDMHFAVLVKDLTA